MFYIFLVAVVSEVATKLPQMEDLSAHKLRAIELNLFKLADQLKKIEGGSQGYGMQPKRTLL